MFKLLPLWSVLLLGLSACVQGDGLPATARKQVGVTLTYNPAYERLSYPMGDIPRERGVCTDVVIRALRDCYNFDLQKAVHEDMKKNFAAYPKNWGLKTTDKNIDHRRVPNLRCFFARQGWQIGGKTPSQKAANYVPGGLGTCTVAGSLPPIMLVSVNKRLHG